MHPLAVLKLHMEKVSGTAYVTAKPDSSLDPGISLSNLIEFPRWVLAGRFEDIAADSLHIGPVILVTAANAQNHPYLKNINSPDILEQILSDALQMRVNETALKQEPDDQDFLDSLQPDNVTQEEWLDG